VSAGVTVSIVSHGQAALVRPLLLQLHAHCRGSIAQVVLTQNLPEAWDVAALGLGFPVHMQVNAWPQGFGANHNQAFAKCQTPWFLVLNPDIELSGDVLADLLSRAPTPVGVIAPLVQEPGAPTHTPERGVITPWEVAIGQRLSDGRRAAPVWFPGMFMLFNAQAFRQVGGFDERFHMYCEDFDICARLRLSGWSLHRDPRVTVVHDAQRHSHVRWRYLLWHVQSLLRLWASVTFWRYWWFARRCD